MEPLGADLMQDQTQTVFSTGLQEATSTEFKKIPKNRDKVLEKLEHHEWGIDEKLWHLRLELDGLDWEQIYEFRKFRDARYAVEWKLRNLEDIRKSLHETYEKFENQIAKLHKGIRHGSINLVKERQLLKQIKQTTGEAEAEKMRPVQFSCIHRSDVSLDTKQALKDHIEVISSEIQKHRLKRMRYRDYGRKESEKAAIRKKITMVTNKLENIKQMKVEASQM
ncbi:hypothetical protein POM88_039826 [Heracleum sosnowskyi]|uniref:Uncharacterized protein n=1 Tax=Heracleum sosnowskyi TaxID=360622 RepID=A0AAD8HB27_9APIA|nr:hypothetical protein POM88_039826 [Heracleum sosnowskyi]